MENVWKFSQNVEKLWEFKENYGKSMENYCLGILYISMSLYLIVIIYIVQKSCIL